jgi:hypothetical protein
MMSMLKQFFSMFASLFLAGDNFAKAAVNISISVDEMSMGYLDEQRHERRKNQIRLAADIAKLEAEYAPGK